MSKRRRDKNKFSKLAKKLSADEPASAPPVNLGYSKASTVVVPPFLRAQVVIAGCGGIGAYAAMHVGRLMRVLYNDQRGVNLTLCDPDVVEEKNLGRQLFCEAEIGMPKAEALGRRYGHAWGLNTQVFVGEYSEFLLHDMDICVIIGCVDNAAARRTLHETLRRNPQRVSPQAPPVIWWLDCGNLKDTGRVMLGSAYSEEQMRGAFHEGKQCIALPSPALQWPTLLIPQRDERDDSKMSCAELQMANLQSLNINAAIAVEASDMLTRLLVTGGLKRYQCAVNLASGSVRSSYCTPEEVANEIDRSVEFVTNSTGNVASDAKAVIMQHIEEIREAMA